MSLRFEDVSQDGRLMLTGIPHGLGETLWRDVLSRHAVHRELLATGVVPILSRLVIDGLDSPIGIARPLEASSAFQLAHTVDTEGAVDRLILNLFLDVYGERGVTHGVQPTGAGERIHVGRAFAEHVFTRPFGPPSERRVLRFENCSLPEVPSDRYEWRQAEALLELPDGARWLEPELVVDTTPLVLGMGHTDSNQHVNSLIYPRLFEAAGLRSLARLGRDTKVLPRATELVFRKPSFAAETLFVWGRTFETDGALGLVGVIRAGDDPRPRVVARMVFEA